MDASAKHCLECDKILRGRTDKKFCDDFCRNGYNNKLNSHSNNHVRNIINILRRNRRILEESLPGKDGMVKTTRSKLTARGFTFEYMTHTYQNKKGNVYYFCFEFGYLPLEGDLVLIVKRKEEATV